MDYKEIKNSVVKEIKERYKLKESEDTITELWKTIINISTDCAIECIKEYESKSKDELEKSIRRKGINI
jgi:hypothetical protein